MQALGLGMDVFRQRVGIGGFQLGQLTPIDDAAWQFVAFGGEFLEQLRGGRPLARFGLRAAGQAHLAEKNVAELLWRADGETLAGSCIDILLQRGGALREFARQARKHLAVHRDAALFHARQHRNQRPLKALVDGNKPVRDKRGFSTCHRRMAMSTPSVA